MILTVTAHYEPDEAGPCLHEIGDALAAGETSGSGHGYSWAVEDDACNDPVALGRILGVGDGRH